MSVRGAHTREDCVRVGNNLIEEAPANPEAYTPSPKPYEIQACDHSLKPTPRPLNPMKFRPATIA